MADDDRVDGDQPGGGADDTDGYRAAVIQLERPSPAPASEGERPPPDPGASTEGEAGLAGVESAAATAAARDAVVLVSERMRRRRIAVRRAEGRRRLRRLHWVLIVVAVLVDGAAIAHLPQFDVKRIEVEGAAQTSAAAVAWMSGLHRGDTLATLDEHRAEQRIERLPWVAEADVIRQWPSTVRIVVTERQPAAVVYASEGFPPAVVDREGRVLSIGRGVPGGLMTLTGLVGGLREGGQLPSSMAPALELGVALNERVAGAVVAVGADLDATLAAGGIVRFGSTDELEEKLVALEAFLSDVDLTGLAVLDLRVPSSPALRRG